MATNPNLREDDVDKGVKKALIIGVSSYEDKSLDSLPFCKNDAEEMHRLLTLLGFEIPVYNMLAGEVKERKMKEAIANFFQDSGIKSLDTLLFYFAGHGVPDNSGEVYMASSETNSKVPFIGSFPFQQLTRLMNGSFSTRIITILDCCHSGAFEITTGSRGDQEDAAKKAHNDIENKSNALKQGSGKCLLAASESTQRAYEIKEKNHGIFTYYLLEGLRGQPQSVDEYGNVTADRLADYVYDTISSLPPKKKPKQMPIRKVEGGGRIILTSYPELVPPQPPRGETSPKDTILELIDKARILLEEKKYDDAVMIFNTILMIRSEHVEALNGKGMALYKQKNYKEALECFEKVLRIEPKHLVACDYMEMIADRLSKERNEETKASGKDIKQDTATLEKRNEKEVIKALNESTKVPAELIKEGDHFYKKGMFLEAILRYDEAIKIEPSSELAWNNKGLALGSLARYEEAIKCFDKAIELNQRLADAWNNKGNALRQLKKYKEAIKCYDRAIKINPNYPEALSSKRDTGNEMFEENIMRITKDGGVQLYDAKGTRNKKDPKKKKTSEENLWRITKDGGVQL
jgi:tetratricopeptide (TPR) repeat protein